MFKFNFLERGLLILTTKSIDILGKDSKEDYKNFRNIIEEYAELGMSLLLSELQEGTDHAQSLLSIILANSSVPQTS